MFAGRVRLLGRALAVSQAGLPPRDRRLAREVLLAAAAKLQAEQAAGLLTPVDLACLNALKRFVVGRGRSGQHRGTFILGLADARACRDPAYWSGALVHDGFHALVQSKGRGARYLDEVGPCNAQIDYMSRTGARPEAIAAVVAFRDSRARQRRRSAETV